MANELPITLVGNITEPELRFTPSGVAVCKFRMAHTERFLNRETQEWEDAEPVWLTVTVWREMAENFANTLVKGARVVVWGRLKSRTYDTKEGEKRTVFEVEANEVGASLRYATGVMTKAGGGGGSGQRGDADWEGASKQRPADRRPAAAATATTAARPSAEGQRQQQAAAGDEAPPW